VLFLRPDRCIAGACIAQRTPELSASLFKVLCLTQGGGSGATRPLLYVAQPATESSGTVTGSP
jgi:3-(3-hydroxy-phenyl)propionate hydroxylase